VFDLDALLECLDATVNLEYLALLNSVPTHLSPLRGIVKPAPRITQLVPSTHLRHILGTIKLFEHLDMPNLDIATLVLLDPSEYSPLQLYNPLLSLPHPLRHHTHYHRASTWKRRTSYRTNQPGTTTFSTGGDTVLRNLLQCTRQQMHP
jgi:hypothetical protein